MLNELSLLKTALSVEYSNYLTLAAESSIFTGKIQPRVGVGPGVGWRWLPVGTVGCGPVGVAVGGPAGDGVVVAV